MLISLAIAAAQAAAPPVPEELPTPPVLERPRYTAPPPPPPPPPRGWSPRAVPAILDPLRSGDIGELDYPAAALASGAEGTVAVRLSIDRTGLVTVCTVMSSSGHSELDTATCRLIRERFRYRPARDARGRFMPDWVVTRMVWRLGDRATPRLPPLPAPPGVVRRAQLVEEVPVGQADYPPIALRMIQQGLSATILEIGPDGRVANCIVRKSSGHMSLDEAACRIAMTRLRFRPARNSAGRPVADVFAYAINWRIDTRPAAPPAGSTSPPQPPR